MIEFRWQGVPIEKLREIFGQDIVNKALTSTEKRVIGTLHKELKKTVRGRYRIKAGTIDKAKEIIYSQSSGKQDVVLSYAGYRLSMKWFNPRNKIARVYSQHFGKNIKRKVVTVKILRNEKKKEIKSVPAFLVKQGTDVRYRKTNERESYRTPTVLSIPEFMTTRQQRVVMDKVLAERIPVEFEHNMNYWLSKALTK